MFLSIKAGLKQLGLFKDKTDEKEILDHIRESAAKPINQMYIEIDILEQLQDMRDEKTAKKDTTPITIEDVRAKGMEMPQSFLDDKIYDNWSGYDNEKRNEEVEKYKNHIKKDGTFGTYEMLGGICTEYNVRILLHTNNFDKPQEVCGTTGTSMGTILLYHNGHMHYQQVYFRLPEGNADPSNINHYKSGVKTGSKESDVLEEYLAERRKEYNDLKNKIIK